MQKLNLSILPIKQTAQFLNCLTGRHTTFYTKKKSRKYWIIRLVGSRDKVYRGDVYMMLPMDHFNL